MNKKIIKFYETPEGKVPFTDRLNSVKDLTYKRLILLRLKRTADGNPGDYKSLGD